MALSSAVLFGKPIISVPEVIKDVFQIFGARWKIILPIIAVQIITAFALGLLFVATLFASITAGYYVDNNNRQLRSLVQHVATGGSTHRYLGNHYSWSDYTGYITSDDDIVSWSHAKYYGLSDLAYYMGSAFTPVMISVAIFALLGVLINSVFTGALVRVAAETYTDKTPTLSESLGYGWDTKFKIFGYSALYFIAEVLVGFLIVMLPNMLAGGLNKGIMICLLLTFGILSTAAKSAIVCGIPSIIVEKQTVGGAYKRSWELCKNKIFFIFGSLFCLVIIEMAVSAILSSISKGLSDVVGFVFPPLFSIMSMVLYVNIRKQAEEFSSATLAAELDTSSNDFVAITTDEIPSKKDMAQAVV